MVLPAGKTFFREDSVSVPHRLWLDTILDCVVVSLNKWFAGHARALGKLGEGTSRSILIAARLQHSPRGPAITATVHAHRRLHLVIARDHKCPDERLLAIKYIFGVVRSKRRTSDKYKPH